MKRTKKTNKKWIASRIRKTKDIARIMVGVLVFKRLIEGVEDAVLFGFFWPRLYFTW